MTERAAHLVDAVLPRVPVRQWVLTVPYRLRYRLAWIHGLSRAVLRVYTRRALDGRHPRIVTFSVDRLSAPPSFQPFRRRCRWHQGCSSDVQ